MIPTLNAAEFLEPCLRSVGVCDGVSVVVCDQGSTDATKAIAFRKGRGVFQLHKGFDAGEAHIRNTMLDWMRNGGQPVCTHYLRLDADELLTDGWLDDIRTIIAAHDPACIQVPYYQLIGTPFYQQVGNPIEERGLVYRLDAGLKWNERPGGVNYHCQLEHTGAVHRTTQPAIIHLGYTKRDIRDRYITNIKRGDWGDSPEGQALDIAKVELNPWQYLPNVESSAPLLRRSKVLYDLVAADKRRATVVDGRITNIV
jgi:glycosyltransferase involved in cell wall biosynthesis